MIRRSSGAGAHPESLLDRWDRPLPVRVTGWAFLVAAALLILGGAYRAQSNLLTTGLLFLAMGVAFAPAVLRRGWPLRIALVALLAVGAVYTFLV